jgi:cytochrome P450
VSYIRGLPDLHTCRLTNFRIAGPESVATLLRVAVLYIITSPRVHRKITAELDEKDLAGALSTPISYKETKELLYLCAVVKEVFRIHPPIG